MGNINEAVTAALSKAIKYSPDNLRAFIAESGGQRAAGRRAGIGESTIRSWLKGSKPRNTDKINEALQKSETLIQAQIDAVTAITITAFGKINLTDGTTLDARGDRTVTHPVLDEDTAQKIVLRAYQDFRYEALAEWTSTFSGNSYYPEQEIEDADCSVVIEY